MCGLSARKQARSRQRHDNIIQISFDCLLGLIVFIFSLMYRHHRAVRASSVNHFPYEGEAEGDNATSPRLKDSYKIYN